MGHEYDDVRILALSPPFYFFYLRARLDVLWYCFFLSILAVSCYRHYRRSFGLLRTNGNLLDWWRCTIIQLPFTDSGMNFVWCLCLILPLSAFSVSVYERISSGHLCIPSITPIYRLLLGNSETTRLVFHSFMQHDYSIVDIIACDRTTLLFYSIQCDQQRSFIHHDSWYSVIIMSL